MKVTNRINNQRYARGRFGHGGEREKAFHL